VAFYQNYTTEPLIIKGLATKWEATKWTFSSLREKCKETFIMTLGYTRDHWGSLGSEEWLDMDGFTRYMEGGYNHQRDWQERRYGFDYNLLDRCPSLSRDFKIPKYFSHCVLQKGEREDAASELNNIRYFWPTMMAGPPSTRSEVHYDDDGLPFWMALLSGRKVFRVLTPKNNPSLIHHPSHPNENEENEQDQERRGWPGLSGDMISSIIPRAFHHASESYGFEIFRPEGYIEEYPELCDLVTHEGILEAGDVIYIPNSSPHGAVNLEATIAITANYASPLDEVQMQYYKLLCEDMPDRGLCLKLSERPSYSSFREMDYFEYAGYTLERWCHDRLQAYTNAYEQEQLDDDLRGKANALSSFCRDQGVDIDDVMPSS